MNSLKERWKVNSPKVESELTQGKVKSGRRTESGEDAIEKLESDFDVFLVREEGRAQMAALTPTFGVSGQIGEEVVHHALFVDGPKHQVMPVPVNQTCREKHRRRKPGKEKGNEREGEMCHPGFKNPAHKNRSQMRLRIAIRGRVRPSVSSSVRPSIRLSRVTFECRKKLVFKLIMSDDEVVKSVIPPWHMLDRTIRRFVRQYRIIFE